MSILDEELVVSDDNDFEDLFPTPKQDVDEEELETVIDDEEYEVEEAPKKKRGRPSKADAAKKSAAGKKKQDEEEAPKKRGRPGRKKAVAVVEDEPEPVEVKKPRKKKEETQIEEVDLIDEEVIDPVPVKKTHQKRLSIDDLPSDAIDMIFEKYSQVPVSELVEELNIPEKYIHKAVSRMKELFEMSVSTGDLTQEDYNEFIAPKVEPYQEPKDSFDAYVRKTVKEIKKSRK